MLAHELARRLLALPADTVAVKFHRWGEPGAEGYDELWFLEGSHTMHEPATQFGGLLVPNRAKWVKGVPKPDLLPAEPTSRSKRKVPFVVLF